MKHFSKMSGKGLISLYRDLQSFNLVLPCIIYI